MQSCGIIAFACVSLSPEWFHSMAQWSRSLHCFAVQQQQKLLLLLHCRATADRTLAAALNVHVYEAEGANRKQFEYDLVRFPAHTGAMHYVIVASGSHHIRPDHHLRTHTQARWDELFGGEPCQHQTLPSTDSLTVSSRCTVDDEAERYLGLQHAASSFALLHCLSISATLPAILAILRQVSALRSIADQIAAAGDISSPSRFVYDYDAIMGHNDGVSLHKHLGVYGKGDRGRAPLRTSGV